MKKSRIIAAAMASIALTGTLGSCCFSPDGNQEADVYGPPAAYEDSSGQYDPAGNDEPDVYGPPDTEEPGEYEAESNIEPGVYGPPEVFGFSVKNNR